MPLQKDIFKELLKKVTTEELRSVINLKADASERKIFRLITLNNSCIGIINENVPENIAFIEFSSAFKKEGLNVPYIYAVSDDNKVYIEEDLGDTTLFLYSKRHFEREKILSKYREALSWLLRFQIESADKINYNLCYQTQSFDANMLNDDIGKFKEYFLNKYFSMDDSISIIESISEIIKDKILQDNYGYFMYRDFQPRNIMVKDDELFFIDYQSGRKGPLQYDVASFLYSGSIDLSQKERAYLLEHYLKELEAKYNTGRNDFMNNFYFYVLARLIQVLGSYSYLYTVRNDPALLQKIPVAVSNMKSIREKFEENEIKEFIGKVVNTF